MFSLIALNQYVLAVQPTEEGELERLARRRRIHYGIGMLAMLLGMLSKPTAMVTPALALVIDLLILRRPWRQAIRTVLPYLLLALPCLVWTKLCQPASYLRHIPIWQRPLIAADALAFYLYKLLLPVHLAYDYGRSPWAIFETHWAWFTWIVPVTIGIVLYRYHNRCMPLLAGALLFVAAVAPLLGFSTFDFEMISTVCDHYLYLAMLGPALAATWALTRVRGENRWPGIATYGVLALLAARSVGQARYWQDSRTFFSHAIDVNPQSWSSWFGLAFVNHTGGRELAARATAEAHQGLDATQDRVLANDSLNEAMECYRQAIRFNAFDVGAHHGYGSMLMYFGRYREAAHEFVEVVRRRDSMNPAARGQYYADTDLLGQCLLYCGHPKEAAHAFAAALALDPAPPDAALHLRQAQAALAGGPLRPEPAVTDTRKESVDSAAGGN
jgi:tetratricopeptide (TPR) repeat protein